MKRSTFCALILTMLAASGVGQATDFSRNVRVDDGFPSPDHILSAMTTDALGNIHVVFADNRSTGNSWSRVYTARSTDQGLTWSNPNTLVSDTAGWEYDYSEIAAGSNGIVYATFFHRAPGVPDGKFFTRSTDGGLTWEHPGRRLDDSTASVYIGPSQIVPLGGDSVLVAWNSGDYHVLIVRSLDAGLHWTAPARLDLVHTNEFWLGRIVRDESGELYAATQGTVDQVTTIYVFSSSDCGAGWSAQPVAVSSVDGTSPDIVTHGDNLYVAYAFFHDWFQCEVYFAASSDRGQTWSTPNIRINDVPNHGWIPRLALDQDGVLHVVFGDDRTGQYDVYYSHSEDNGATWSPNEIVNDDSIRAQQADPVIWGGTSDQIYMTWGDDRSGNDNCGVYFSRVLQPNVTNHSAPEASSIALLSAYPNPFNSATTLVYTVAQPSRVVVQLSDILGRRVAVLVNSSQTAGAHQLRFDAGALPSGTYVVRLTAGHSTSSHKIALIR